MKYNLTLLLEYSSQILTLFCQPTIGVLISPPPSHGGITKNSLISVFVSQ